MSVDVSVRLLDHALSLRWQDLPNPTREAARAFLLDSLSVGAAGVHAPEADAALAVAKGWGQGGTAGILGRQNMCLPASSAAFVNGFQIHGQEFDCVHEAAVLHPMATIMSTLLAEVSRGDLVQGEDFLAAIVAGVDVAVTLGLAAPGPLTFFRPATAGIFGCVAAIVRARRLPLALALDAFGHALAFASGTMQAHVEGKPALPIQVANAARNALAAVDLAMAGVAGIRGTIEGPFGLLSLFEGATDLRPALEKLSVGHRIEETSWKPFPTGRAGHGGIDAVQHLIAKGVRPETLHTLEFHAPPLIHRLVGRPAHPGMAPGYARLCLPYLAAVTLRTGTVSLTDFGQSALNDPLTLALAAKVSVVSDGNVDAAAFVPAVAKARLTDGSLLLEHVTAMPGAPQRPLTPVQQVEKARACLDFAGLGDCLEPLLDSVRQLEFSVDAMTCLRRSGLLA